jgi:hypothetical protein
MAWVHQIKLFYKDQELYAALYDDSHIGEFWIANLKASDLGITTIPKNFIIERKYRIQDLNIRPFEYSQNNLLFQVGDFINRFVKGRPVSEVIQGIRFFDIVRRSAIALHFFSLNTKQLHLHHFPIQHGK